MGWKVAILPMEVTPLTFSNICLLSSVSNEKPLSKGSTSNPGSLSFFSLVIAVSMGSQVDKASALWDWGTPSSKRQLHWKNMKWVRCESAFWLKLSSEAHVIQDSLILLFQTIHLKATISLQSAWLSKNVRSFTVCYNADAEENRLRKFTCSHVLFSPQSKDMSLPKLFEGVLAKCTCPIF